MQVQPRVDINVLNVENISVDDLVAFIYPMKSIPDANDIDAIAPLLPHFANEYNLFSQLHAKMMAVKARNKSTENSIKIDVLYRALRCAEMNYNAVSRILTVMQSKNPSQRWGHDDLGFKQFGG